MKLNILSKLTALVFCLCLSSKGASQDLRTVAEQTNWEQTGRLDEVQKFCSTLSKKFPKKAKCEVFGHSPEGRPMLSLVLGRAAQAPVVLVQGGIHAGEIDGKDAILALARDILDQKLLPHVLDKMTLVFVPVFNVDGHERFGLNTRPNQNGPKEKGWRTTALNYNLNRDYLKADAPEMQAMLQLLGKWNPLVYVDLHVTDGAQFEQDISVQVDPRQAGPESLREIGEALNKTFMHELEAAGFLPVWFYPSFRVEDDPLSGFTLSPQSPRFSNGYWALQNRLGILVETHSWRPYQHRVKSTYETLRILLVELQKNGLHWSSIVSDLDAKERLWRGKNLTLTYENTEKSRLIDFRGYAYERSKSSISGQLMTRYKPNEKQMWKVPLWEEVAPKLSLSVPEGGYLIPPAYRSLIEPKLRLHKVEYSVLKKEISDRQAARFYFEDVKLSSQSYERRQTAQYQGAWKSEKLTLPSGSLYIPSEQSRIRLVMTLLEPQSPDSLVAWGFFNEVFERKEYMEAYVTEDVAIQMMKDPAIREEFEQRLAQDPAFAKNPQARLDFFYRKHPSFDDRWMRYPVWQIRETLF